MVLDADVKYLSITAVIFSSLCGLFGVYITLFGLAIWATYQKEGQAYKCLRIMTLIMFLDLAVHLTSQAFLFARSRVIPAPVEERQRWTVPMSVLQGLTTTVAGLLSDGLLAWRFFVIFNRRPWAKWVPTCAITINTLLGLSANLLPLAIYHDAELYNGKLHKISLQISATWGWCMFAVHTLLTSSIIIRIVCVSRPVHKMVKDVTSLRLQYTDILRAIIESSFITWIGLLMYEIAAFAPDGQITTNFDVGYVMGAILPIFFGIAQCLITARLGSAGVCKRGHVETLSPPPSPMRPLRPFDVAIAVTTEVHQDWSLKQDLVRDEYDSPTTSSSIAV